GTTLIEADAANRRCIGCDINEKALAISRQRVPNKSIILLKRDARTLIGIEDNSIDLICTHPPYAGIIKYSKDIKEDISLMDINNFYIAMEKVAEECFRVLKRGKICAILMGDTSQKGYIVPLCFNVMNIFIKKGFKLKEIVIKEQHNCKSTDYWAKISAERNFLLIAHEYLLVFHKA
ncbi:MAG TPA: site-specific DNA-methyltransferase, partial [Clostridium sp.]|nr:site-specific DNA-methyltransferase [Clostridium sp.]